MTALHVVPATGPVGTPGPCYRIVLLNASGIHVRAAGSVQWQAEAYAVNVLAANADAIAADLAEVRLYLGRKRVW